MVKTQKNNTSLPKQAAANHTNTTSKQAATIQLVQQSLQAKIAALKAHTAELKKLTLHDNEIT